MSDIDEVYMVIMNETYQTGTIAYGMEAKDNDRFASRATVAKIVGMLNGLGIFLSLESRDSYESSEGIWSRVRFKLPMLDKCIDLFVVNDDELITFQLVTDMVGMAARHMPGAARQKELRVHLFRMLRYEFRLWKAMTPAVATAAGRGA